MEYADIVLPATTFLEHSDLYKAYGHHYLQKADPAISPVGESKSNPEVFQLLAARLGFGEDLFREGVDAQIHGVMDTKAPELHGITYADILDCRPHRLNVSAQTYAGGFPTPSGKLEFYSKSMKQAGFDPLPYYQPCCSEEDRKAQGDLHLIAPPSKHFLNTSFGSVPSLVARAGRPTLLMHPEEARKRAIEDGQMVRVHNSLGECRLYAVVTDDVPTNVVVAASVWWAKHSPEGKGINQLTSPKTTDMAGGSTFHCNRVFVTPD